MAAISGSGSHAVIILGASGFIGRRLCERLREEGRTFVGWSSAECDLLDAARTRERLDVCTPETTVVMCASVSRVIDDSWQSFQANTAMVRNVMEALNRRPPRSLVFLSSSDVYGLPAVELPISEETLTRPTTFYGLAKLASESLLLLMREGTWPIAHLRLPGIYGPGDGGRSVVGRFCERLSQQQPIQITGSGKVARDYVYVDDLCQLIETLHEQPYEGTVNVATADSISVSRLVELVAASIGVHPAIEHLPPQADRDHDLTFDTRRLREVFPRSQFRTIERGIHDYLNGRRS